MGSPISGLFADIVMAVLDMECLRNLSFSPLFYYRYVDDIITCIPIDKLDEILQIFNSYDNRLQFTHEIEIENKISFLDILLIKNDDGYIETNWYHKPTFSGRCLNFLSQHPKHQKIAMVYNYVDRAIKLSDEKYHDENITKVKSFLNDNNYPDFFINKYVTSRLNKIRNNNNNYTKENKSKNYNRVVVIPFVQGVYERISHKLKNYQINVVPKSANSLNKIITKGKDKIKKCDKNNVIYRVKCKDCNASYVGQTKRSFRIRKGEHLRQKSSMIHQHLQENDTHKFDWKRFDVLNVERNQTSRNITEMLYIQSQPNAINKQEDTLSFNDMYTNTSYHYRNIKSQ